MDEMELKGLCPFTFAQTGDRVYDAEKGWGYVDGVYYGVAHLIVKFDDAVPFRYTLSGYRDNGKWDGTEKQVLFWDDECTEKPMMPESIRQRNRVENKVTFGFGG